MRSLLLILVLMMISIRKGASINCYTCVSRNYENEACDKGWGSAGYTRDCRTEAGQTANYCIKIEGQGMNTKGPVTIRGCNTQPWNIISTSEQPIQYSSFNVIGRVMSCDTDYCNGSTAHAPTWMILAGAALFALLCTYKGMSPF